VKPSSSVRARIRHVGAHTWRKEVCAGAWFGQGQAGAWFGQGQAGAWFGLRHPSNRLAPEYMAQGKPVTDPE
jgi:hypothetical protein